MEWFGTTEEATRLRHNTYGGGNMDVLLAPQDADVAARDGQPKTMVRGMEQDYLRLWLKKQKQQGVNMGEIAKDVVLEPNRQLKVPIPVHRYVRNVIKSSNSSEVVGLGAGNSSNSSNSK